MLEDGILLRTIRAGGRGSVMYLFFQTTDLSVPGRVTVIGQEKVVANPR